MKDIKGINRGHCIECGPEECDEFIKGGNLFSCAYCGHNPIKHVKSPTTATDLDLVVTSEDINIKSIITTTETTTSETAAPSMDFESETVKDEYTITVADLDENTEISNNSIITDLPSFSPCIVTALEDGTIKGRLWSNLIMQAASFYLKNKNMCTKRSYDEVGRMMFDKYPSIETIGMKPWSHFTKCLSQKIRHERIRAKEFRRKNFDASPGKKKRNIRREKVLKAKNYLRSNIKLPEVSSEKLLEIRKRIKEEWNKKDKDGGLIKSLLRDSFHDRTSLLSSYGWMEEYPCFEEAEFFIYELRILIGREEMEKLHDRVKLFFEKIKKDEDQTFLKSWLEFEKKTGNYHVSKKTTPIIQVLEDAESFRERTVKDFTDKPCGYALLKDGKVQDVVAKYESHIIFSKAPDIPYLITLLLAMYYVLELNYPKKYLQAMGVLGCFALDDKFYKLGVKATRVLDSLLK